MSVLSLRSRRRTVRAALVLAVLAALAFGVPGTAAAATPKAEPWHLSWTESGVGTIHVWVRYNHAKTITICDARSDTAVPVLSVDPSGPQAPINYRDGSGGDGKCFTRTIGYSVRKMRVGVWNTWYSWPEGIFWRGNWYQAPPMPYPDF